MMKDSQCRNIISKLNAYIDGEFDQPENEVIEYHLDSCIQCKKEYDQLKELNSILAEYTEPKCPPELINNLKLIPHLNQKTGYLTGLFNYLKPLPVAASILLSIFSAFIVGNNLTNQQAGQTVTQDYMIAEESLFTVLQEAYYE